MKKNTKETQGLGMPWEKEYGYAQAVKVGDTVWIAGQVGHDDKGVLKEGMEAQVKQAYANISVLLERFGMTMDDVVEEVLYVLDTQSAFESRKKIGQKIFKNPMYIASTMVAVVGLVLPHQLVEIKIVAKSLN